jgi:tetratricopeptide (TPR) repeat protein
MTMKRQLPILLIVATFVVFIASIGFYIYLKRVHRAMSYFQTVGEYVQQGKLDEAISILKNTISKNPSAAEAHAALGMIYNKKDMLDDALSELKTALNLKPSLVNIYQEMYLIYKKKGMEEEAKNVLGTYEKLKEK